MNQPAPHTKAETSLGLWLRSLKIGVLVVLLFMGACFVYGWFKPFSFWHAYADAGFHSAIAHALYYGVFAGPVIFVFVTAMVRFLIKKRTRNQ